MRESEVLAVCGAKNEVDVIFSAISNLDNLSEDPRSEISVFIY